MVGCRWSLVVVVVVVDWSLVVVVVVVAFVPRPLIGRLTHKMHPMSQQWSIVHPTSIPPTVTPLPPLMPSISAMHFLTCPTLMSAPMPVPPTPTSPLPLSPPMPPTPPLPMPMSQLPPPLTQLISAHASSLQPNLGYPQIVFWVRETFACVCVCVCGGGVCVCVGICMGECMGVCMDAYVRERDV